MDKKLFFLMILALFIAVGGCTRIVKLEPSSGPPGSPVWVKSTGQWGSPGGNTLKWDGKTLCEHFAGSFIVPAVAQPGEHKVTLIDRVDASEAWLVVPLARIRHSSATFTVTE